MKPKLYFYILIRVVVFFAAGFMGAWFFEGQHEFFGDTYVTHEYIGYSKPELQPCDPYWSWSIRHYWFLWGTVFIILLSLIDAIVGIRRMVFKTHPELKVEL